MPECIKHHPGVVLDVIVSSTADNSLSEPTTEIPSVSLAEEQSSTSVTTLELEPEVMQRLASTLSPDIQAQLLSSSDGYSLINPIAQAINDGTVDSSEVIRKCFQELKDEMNKNKELSDRIIKPQEEIDRPHTQTCKQQALLRKYDDSILDRRYEFHQGASPGLCVILLRDSSSWNYVDFFSIKFCLYASVKHEGYEVDDIEVLGRPCTENDLLAMTLEMLKIGISEDG
ncbi:hypothetical protein BGX34_003899, partial [Mortierella sp. NVP85]